MTRTGPTGRYAPPHPAETLRVRSSDAVTLNVEVHGPSHAPTVVLIHGWTCRISFWAPVIHALRDELRIVAYDQRGHGASDVPGRGHYSTQALVDDLTAVLDHTVPAGERAVLAGHSMGGMTVMGAATRESVLSRTRSALLASTGYDGLVASARIVTQRAPRLAAATQRVILRSTLPTGRISFLSRAAITYGTLGPGASKELATVNAGIVHACGRRPRGAWGRVLETLDVGDAAASLDVPARVLVGTADRLTPPVHALRIADRLPRCEGVTQLPGIGHMTPLEAPDVVAGLIRELAAADPGTPAGPRGAGNACTQDGPDAVEDEDAP